MEARRTCDSLPARTLYLEGLAFRINAPPTVLQKNGRTAGAGVKTTVCFRDNPSALKAEGHTDEHLELAVWDTTFLNSILRMMPDLNPVGLAKVCNTFSSRHLANKELHRESAWHAQSYSPHWPA